MPRTPRRRGRRVESDFRAVKKLKDGMRVTIVNPTQRDLGPLQFLRARMYFTRGTHYAYLTRGAAVKLRMHGAGLRAVRPLDHEGRTWCRGWSGPNVRALKAACAI